MQPAWETIALEHLQTMHTTMQAFTPCTQWSTVHQCAVTRVMCIQVEKLHTEVQRVQ